MIRIGKAALFLVLALGPASVAGAGEKAADEPTIDMKKIEALIDPDKMKAEDKELELPPRAEKPLELSLNEAVRLAIANNFDLQVERLNPELRGADLEIERSEFDATVGASANTDVDHSRSAGSYARDGSAYISRKILTGADVRTSLVASRPSNSDYSGGISVLITQPLLRNFGFDVNRADITIAENNLAIAESRLVEQLIDTVAEVHRAYWDLVLFCRRTEVRRSSLQRAQSLVDEIQIRRRVGAATTIQMLDARTQAALRRVALVNAEAHVKAAEDNLKAITNLAATYPDDKNFLSWRRPLLPTTEAPFDEKDVDLTASISDAFKFRPDYFQQRKTLENSGISLRYARNQLYPELDLSASFGLTSTAKEMGDITNQGRSNWDVGASFSVPLGNRRRKNLLRKRELEERQSLLRFKALEQTIIVEVRRAIRGIETSVRSVKAARIAVDTAKAILDANRFLLDKGGVGVTTREILQHQDSLERASLDYLNAVVEYNKSLITLEQAKGTLLKTYNIEVKRQ